MLVITRSQLEMRQQSSLLVQQAMGTLDRRWVMNAPPPPTPPADDPQPSITDITDAVKTSFNRAPKETAMAILDGLSDLDRVHLLLAFQTSTKKEILQRQEAYVDDLLKIVKTSPTHSMLTRGQVANAVAYQKMLQRYSSYSHQPPTFRQLSMVAVASGLPFVGFGFCDNSIMILAGDAVDAVFGARLGITTLAAAGLGNIVADVVGVGATQQIKETSRKIKWAQPPRLSTLQQAMGSVKVAKISGACMGVCFGCILGMVPLVFLEEGFFEKPGEKNRHTIAAAAKAAEAEKLKT